MDKYDLTNQTFGYWTVIGKDAPRPGCKNSLWICKCACGNVRSVLRHSLVNGVSQSCGCKPRPCLKGINATHGMSKTRLYHEWCSMRRRCKENTKDAKTYYNRGIKVCDEWMNDFTSFRDWALSNGYSNDLSLDRIDNNKGYYAENCRWVPIEQQQNNRSNSIIVEYNGQPWCLRTLCMHIGFSYKLAHNRYRNALKKGRVLNAAELFAPINAKKSSRLRSSCSQKNS